MLLNATAGMRIVATVALLCCGPSERNRNSTVTANDTLLTKGRFRQDPQLHLKGAQVILATLTMGQTSATRNIVHDVILTAAWEQTCDDLYEVRPDSIKNADASILDGLATFQLIYVACDFAMLQDGTGLEFRDGEWKIPGALDL